MPKEVSVEEGAAFYAHVEKILDDVFNNKYFEGEEVNISNVFSFIEEAVDASPYATDPDFIPTLLKIGAIEQEKLRNSAMLKIRNILIAIVGDRAVVHPRYAELEQERDRLHEQEKRKVIADLLTAATVKKEEVITFVVEFLNYSYGNFFSIKGFLREIQEIENGEENNNEEIAKSTSAENAESTKQENDQRKQKGNSEETNTTQETADAETTR